MVAINAAPNNAVIANADVVQNAILTAPRMPPPWMHNPHVHVATLTGTPQHTLTAHATPIAVVVQTTLQAATAAIRKARHVQDAAVAVADAHAPKVVATPQTSSATPRKISQLIATLLAHRLHPAQTPLHHNSSNRGSVVVSRVQTSTRKPLHRKTKASQRIRRNTPRLNTIRLILSAAAAVVVVPVVVVAVTLKTLKQTSHKHRIHLHPAMIVPVQPLRPQRQSHPWLSQPPQISLLQHLSNPKLLSLQKSPLLLLTRNLRSKLPR